MDVNLMVSRDPEIVSGELVFSGTRVPVKTLDDFLDDFLSVGREQTISYLETSRRIVSRKTRSSAERGL